MTVSFGYKIPLLMHQGYDVIDEMKAASFYYSLGTYASQLDEFIAARDKKVNEIKSSKRYSPEEQQKRYLDFLIN
jgi:hypothetical protein